MIFEYTIVMFFTVLAVNILQANWEWLASCVAAAGTLFGIMRVINLDKRKKAKDLKQLEEQKRLEQQGIKDSIRNLSSSMDATDNSIQQITKSRANCNNFHQDRYDKLFEEFKDSNRCVMKSIEGLRESTNEKFNILDGKIHDISTTLIKK